MIRPPPAPLWRQVLTMRNLELEDQKNQRKRSPGDRVGNYIAADDGMVRGLLREVSDTWGVRPIEIVQQMPHRGPHCRGFAHAARAEFLRECWRARIAPGQVARVTGILVRSVGRYYTECKRRLGQREGKAA